MSSNSKNDVSNAEVQEREALNGDSEASETAEQSTVPENDDRENEEGSEIIEEPEGNDYERDLTDSEGEDEFIKRYGDVEFQYIRRPRDAVWFIRPHALNYFKDGVLHRTKGERTSGKTELFVDLLYVGIIANLAGSASESAGGIALLKYVLFFIPAWVVWADIKDFTNYYYNEDLSQKVYIIWILALLTLYANSHEQVLEGNRGAALTIVPYILCRLSLSASLMIYSFYIPEHRPQMRIYSVSLIFTCCLWIPVIFIPIRAKIGLAFAIMFLEQVFYVLCYHPWIKKKLKLTTSTALNIEHEVERLAVFVTIAIGEYLYSVVARSPLGSGLTDKFARGVFLLIIAYSLFWIYNYGGTSKKATHPVRRSGFHAVLWINSHIPLIASIVLSADAGGELAKLDYTDLSKHRHMEEPTELRLRAEEEEIPNMYALSFFFTGGICVALISMFIMGHAELSKDDPGLHLLPKIWRIFLRVPIAIIILCLSFAEMNSTLMMGMTAMLLVILLVYESFISTPRHLLHRSLNKS